MHVRARCAYDARAMARRWQWQWHNPARQGPRDHGHAGTRSGTRHPGRGRAHDTRVTCHEDFRGSWNVVPVVRCGVRGHGPL